MVRRVLSVILNAAIAIVVFTVLFNMTRTRGWLLKDSAGRSNLRMFTTLSNIFEGIAAAAYVLCALYGLIRGRTSIPRRAVLLKYTATVSVAITFLTALLYLSPAQGDFSGMMFHGTNKFFHFAVPLAAIIDMLFLERDARLTFTESFIPVIPVAAYAVYYVLNLIINGVGRGRGTNDWYGFLMKGVGFAPVVFAVFLLLAWGLALLFRLPVRDKRI